MRKVIILLIFLLYILAFPPLNAIYNRGGFVFGIPTFIFGIMIISSLLVFLTFILYRYENKNKDEE